MSTQNKLIINWQLSICLTLFILSATDVSGFSAVLAQSSKPSSKTQINQPSNRNRGWLLDKILGLLKPKVRVGGSRGSGSSRPVEPRTGEGLICANSPAFKSDSPYLWTRQPLLTWNGSPSVLQIIDVQSKEIIWQKSVESNVSTREVRVDKSLELGRKYSWRTMSKPDKINSEVSFQIVDIGKWDMIDRNLKALEQNLKQQNLDPEEIALEKINYFARREMWGDVQEIIARLPTTSRQKEEFIQLGNQIQDELSVCSRKLK